MNRSCFILMVYKRSKDGIFKVQKTQKRVYISKKIVYMSPNKIICHYTDMLL